MDHEKIYKPAFRAILVDSEITPEWVDSFFKQVDKDYELIRASEIMKSLEFPKSVTIELSENDLFANK